MKEIFIKYGELSTKKNNKNYFIKVLKSNIEKSIDNIEVSYDFGRMFIKVLNNDYTTVVDKLRNIFGIHEIVVCEKYNDKVIDSIKDNVLKNIKNIRFNTFKVETKRSDKTYPIKSTEVSKVVGGYILKNIPNIKVDVNSPELLINIEIRNEEVLIYHDSIRGIGGYPVGTLGKGLLMLSGGIDSPVSGYLAMKRGVNIDAVYFESPPHTSDMARNKVVELASIISKYGHNVNVHVINFTEIQENIYKNIPHEYLVTIMRRMMYRISERVAKNTKADIIINGESIGQVASQTLKSMKVINEVVSTPVIRPVACLDKLEIIDIAKSIGTYETSILPYEDCCTIFVPDHPVINPEEDKCIMYEKTFDYESLIDKAIKERKIIKANEKKYQDLL